MVRDEKYSEAFAYFKETEFYQNYQAGRILSHIEQYYSGKLRAKELRDASREVDIYVDEAFSKSDDEYCYKTQILTSAFEESRLLMKWAHAMQMELNSREK